MRELKLIVQYAQIRQGACRTSQEVRELKSTNSDGNFVHPGRTSQEVRELKFGVLPRFHSVGSRTSQEVRELKSPRQYTRPVPAVAPRKRCVS